MRKAVLVIALAAVALAYVAAGEFGEPNFYFSEAEIGFVLPEDTEQYEGDDGSVSDGYMVLANSVAAKGKTFVIGIFGPSTKEDFDNPVFVAMMGMQYKVENY